METLPLTIFRMLISLNSKQKKFFGKQNIMFVDRDEEIAVFDDDGEEFRPSLVFLKRNETEPGSYVWFFHQQLTLNPSQKFCGPSNIV